MAKETNNRDVLSYGLAAVAVGIAWSTHGNISSTLHGLPRNEEAKPFTELGSFYGFYLQEHRDPTCRILHFIGTRLASIKILRSGFLPHLLCGLSLGLILCEFLSPLSNGAIEFVSVAAVSFFSSFLLSNRPFPWQIFILGYAPAWLGHFFFEHNRPATFIYPSYSLLCDYRMLWQMTQGELSWSERL